MPQHPFHRQQKPLDTKQESRRAGSSGLAARIRNSLKDKSQNRRPYFLLPVLILVLMAGFWGSRYFFTPVESQRYRVNLLEAMLKASDFDSFSNALFCYEVSSDSITTAYTLKNPGRYHIPSLEPVLSSFSHSEYQKDQEHGTQEKLLSALSRQLSAFDYQSLNKEEQLTCRLLEKNFELDRRLSQYAYYEELIGSQSGIPANLPVTLSEYPLRSENDICTYLNLLTQIPSYFENIIAYEQKRTKLGYPTPYFILKETRDSLSEMIESMEDGSDCLTETFELRIRRIPEISQKKRMAYIGQNEKYVRKYVLSAYRSIRQYTEKCMENDTAKPKNKKKNTLPQNAGSDRKAHTADQPEKNGSPGTADNTGSLTESSSRNLEDIPEPDTAYGLSSLPNGREYYELLVKKNTGSAKSVPELIACTEQSLKQSIGEIFKLALTDQESYLYYCDHAPQSYFQSPEAILEALSLMCKADYPALANQPSYEVKTVSKSLQQCSSPAFYMIPAIDDYQHNTIYINPLYTGTDSGNLFTTLAHEGFPGHLYQTVYYNSTSPCALRQLLNYPGYVEGWATYVELDSYSYLDYGDKESLCPLYQADTLINLALCSRIDLGVNYEGWTLNDVNTFFNDNGFKSYHGADVYAYVVQAPATYLRYFIGYLEIMELKEEYQRLKMEAFSEKEFHKAFLEIGPADFETLREELLGKEDSFRDK